MEERQSVLQEMGFTKEEIDAKTEDVFSQIFYGEDRFYHVCKEDPTMGYLEDTGNHDTRTEGISYGMMMCVQLDHKKEFDCLWKWAKTMMYMKEGPQKGYFAWSVATDGTKNAYGPAPDGEEFFAMALFFAAHRWGNGEGIFNYEQQAKEILHTCLHKSEEPGRRDMWDPQNHLIRFITECDFSDPSYHLPHFYTLFAKWANEEDREFWEVAARASREFLRKACHPDTGLCAEYSYFDGRPYDREKEIWGDHSRYFSDAYRTIGNIALDYQWFLQGTEEGEWNREIAARLQKFFCETVKENDRGIYTIDGEILAGKALHPIAITATNAQASIASNGPYARECVQRFLDTPLRTGNRRYYDNCLYLFALLALGGNYRIW